MKYVLITGGTSGIGEATATALAKQGFYITLMARNIEKAQSYVSRIKERSNNNNISILKGDLASLSSIENAAAEYTNQIGKLDILINNAGGIFNQYEKTTDDLEWGFQVNYLSHFLLTNRLLPLLRQSSDARIIHLSSEAHRIGKIDFANLNCEKSFGGWRQYGATKLMNILFSNELHHRFNTEGIASFSLHPGVVRTNFGKNNSGILQFFSLMPFIKTPEEGASTSIFLATQPTTIRKFSGNYLKDSKLAIPIKTATDKVVQQQLWEASVRILKEKGFANL